MYHGEPGEGNGVPRRSVLLGAGVTLSALGARPARGAGIALRQGDDAGTDWRGYRGGPRGRGRTAPIDEPDGEHWAVGSGNEQATSPTAVGERLYVGSGDRLLAIDTDGSVAWSHSTPGVVSRSVAVAGGLVFAVTGDGYLVAVDREGGSEQWRQGTNLTLTPPTTGDGVVCVGSKSGELLAFDAVDGTFRWRHSEPVNYSGPGWIREVPNDLYPTPAIADGTVYVHFPHDDGTRLFSLGASDGSVEWETTIAEGTEVYAPVVGEDGIYVLGGEFVKRVSRSGGVQQWSVSTSVGAHSLEPPALGEGAVFVSTHDNSRATYLALGKDSGEIVWQYEADGEAMNGVSTDGSTAYVVADGSLVAINGETGLENWRHSLDDVTSAHAPVGIPGGKGVVLRTGDRVRKLGPERSGEAGSTDDDGATPIESGGGQSPTADPGSETVSGGGSDAAGSSPSDGDGLSLSFIESVVVIVSSILGGLYTVYRMIGR
jgi:outer membrane protein assembly factor BamB